MFFKDNHTYWVKGNALIGGGNALIGGSVLSNSVFTVTDSKINGIYPITSNTVVGVDKLYEIDRLVEDPDEVISFYDMFYWGNYSLNNLYTQIDSDYLYPANVGGIVVFSIGASIEEKELLPQPLRASSFEPFPYYDIQDLDEGVRITVLATPPTSFGANLIYDISNVKGITRRVEIARANNVARVGFAERGIGIFSSSGIISHTTNSPVITLPANLGVASSNNHFRYAIAGTSVDIKSASLKSTGHSVLESLTVNRPTILYNEQRNLLPSSNITEWSINGTGSSYVDGNLYIAANAYPGTGVYTPITHRLLTRPGYRYTISADYQTDGPVQCAPGLEFIGSHIHRGTFVISSNTATLAGDTCSYTIKPLTSNSFRISVSAVANVATTLVSSLYVNSNGYPVIIRNPQIEIGSVSEFQPMPNTFSGSVGLWDKAGNADMRMSSSIPGNNFYTAAIDIAGKVFESQVNQADPPTLKLGRQADVIMKRGSAFTSQEKYNISRYAHLKFGKPIKPLVEYKVDSSFVDRLVDLQGNYDAYKVGNVNLVDGEWVQGAGGILRTNPIDLRYTNHITVVTKVRKNGSYLQLIAEMGKLWYDHGSYYLSTEHEYTVSIGGTGVKQWRCLTFSPTVEDVIVATINREDRTCKIWINGKNISATLFGDGAPITGPFTYYHLCLLGRFDGSAITTTGAAMLNYFAMYDSVIPDYMISDISNELMSS